MQTPGCSKSAWCRKDNTRIDGLNPNGYVRNREDLQDLKGPGFCRYDRCVSGLRPPSMRAAVRSCRKNQGDMLTHESSFLEVFAVFAVKHWVGDPLCYGCVPESQGQ
jgi:hypothetical protein